MIAKYALTLYPILSMMRLNIMILKANGQRPTPRICPISAWEKLNSETNCPTTTDLKPKKNEVATKAMKQAQKSFLFSNSLVIGRKEGVEML